ncbi:response regulator [Roseateles sp.]|uniref:response regulator n=1 Tax=Roseateles sp. TaxID=1971397 RepID=UPI003BA4A2D1
MSVPFSLGSASPPPTSSQAACAQAHGRLLYIEDNAVNTLVVEELVASRPGIALSCAVDGAQGLQSAQALLPDLILLDMHLPDFDGYEVLRRLRADPRTAHIPCIALSANAMSEDKRLALGAGFLAYWTKPIDFKAVLAGLDTFFASSPANALENR